MRFLSLLTLFTTTRAGDEDMFSLAPNYAYSNQVGSQALLSNEAFGDSWNTPSNAPYSPSVSNFDRVVLELHVNSTGLNYDRLGRLFIDDIEIWRTSTAEPDGKGASWTVRKDVSHYASLFRYPRTINFLITNRVTNEYTGVFFVTLTAYFYSNDGSTAVTGDSWAIDLDEDPDTIQALSKPGSSATSGWITPSDNISVSVGPLSREVNRAVVHVFASGNSDDEFWWDSVHSSSTAGPSRFVDVYVGGQLAGFATPYPVIFTGGVDPLLWRPLVDLRAFDLPAYYIDITPFLPALWDASTPIALKMSNGIDDSEIPSNWIISYNLLTWSTSGQSNSGSTDTPQITQSGSGTGSTSVLVNRDIKVSATLNIGGSDQSVGWEQSVAYNNTLTSANANESHVWQTSQGSNAVTGLHSFKSQYNYQFQAEMDNNNEYRIQQTYNVESNNQTYNTWIDTTVWLSNGDYQNAASSQWIQYPGGSHYAETKNLVVTEHW